jgi:hypothetical protein
MLEFVPDYSVLVSVTTDVDYHVINHSTDELCHCVTMRGEFPNKEVVVRGQASAFGYSPTLFQNAMTSPGTLLDEISEDLGSHVRLHLERHFFCFAL